MKVSEVPRRLRADGWVRVKSKALTGSSSIRIGPAE
jgi:predicted RNA binding protein YcfA (HicA-like mRNA interferase family)